MLVSFSQHAYSDEKYVCKECCPLVGYKYLNNPQYCLFPKLKVIVSVFGHKTMTSKVGD
jgi:hypothetical protein